MASTPSPPAEPDLPGPRTGEVEPSPADPGAGTDGDEQEETDAADARALLVSLDDRWLAVRAGAVDAVVRPAPVTPVGGTPRWVVGMAAIRGAVVGVVDAGLLAGAAAAEPAAEAWWVVVTDGARAAAVAGLRVWQVARVEGEAGAPESSLGPAAAPAPPGLPAGEVVRLAGDKGRGADALPPAARLLDVAALLDLIHDPTHEP